MCRAVRKEIDGINQRILHFGTMTEQLIEANQRLQIELAEYTRKESLIKSGIAKVPQP